MEEVDVDRIVEAIERSQAIVPREPLFYLIAELRHGTPEVCVMPVIALDRSGDGGFVPIVLSDGCALRWDGELDRAHCEGQLVTAEESKDPKVLGSVIEAAAHLRELREKRAERAVRAAS